jgi:L,D-transpeptidase ErfK/SrfK
MLFHFGPGAVSAYPIAAGSRSWPTPLEEFSVLTLEVDPVWDVPLSIQEEMRAQGKPVLTRVPAGQGNPLGTHWIGTSIPGIGIHGTNAPSSIYSLQTHGCIRVHPVNIGALFEKVSLGAPGRVIYEPVLLALADGLVYLEAHPDGYRVGQPAAEVARKLAREAGVENAVDWNAAEEVIRKREGIARVVGWFID